MTSSDATVQSIFSSATDYDVSLAIFHNSHGLPTPVNGDRKYAEGNQDKYRRRDAAKRINIWR